jgi:hypothetical protein
MLAAAENPPSVAGRMARQLAEDDVVELLSSFRPEPLLGAMSEV